jgi:hypothetical protein
VTQAGDHGVRVLQRVVVNLRDDTQLFKEFSDNESFRAGFPT